MSTINGIIKDTQDAARGNVQVVFCPQDTPFAQADDDVITSTAKTAVTNSSGAFTIDLVAGVYKVKVYKPDEKAYDLLTITVPASGTYNLADLITSSPATTGSANQNVSFDAPYAVGAVGEYIGGRFRWAVVAVLKSASMVLGRAPVGTAFAVQLEVDGSVVASQTMTVNSGGTSAEITLPNIQVTAGEYVRWIVTGAPADVENWPSNVSLSMNLTT